MYQKVRLTCEYAIHDLFRVSIDPENRSVYLPVHGDGVAELRQGGEAVWTAEGVAVCVTPHQDRFTVSIILRHPQQTIEAAAA